MSATAFSPISPASWSSATTLSGTPRSFSASWCSSGAIHLGLRIRAAWKGLEASRSLVAHRMIAILGALGGFTAYLRGLPRPEARLGLVLGGISAAPWAAVVLLELVRRRRGGDPGSERGARE